MIEDKWIPITERLPENGDYILISFENATIPEIGRYEEDKEGGAFYIGDDDSPCASYGLYVNAWMEIPKPYREKAGEVMKGDTM